MKKKLAVMLFAVGLAGAGLAMISSRGESQPAGGTRLVVGVYAPTVEFGTAAARLTYVQGLAKAIATNTGAKVDAKSFASLAALRKENPDFAIVDGQCYAVNRQWGILANAKIGGGTTRNWALYSSVGGAMQGLKGQKLAYVQTGCNDNGFIENAMLESEVALSYFGGKVGKSDVTAAVAEVASYKGAQAVFAPTGSQKGLAKVFDTGAVPNPAFVQINNKLPAALVSKVSSAVVSYGGGGAIEGWTGGSDGPYKALSGRMAKQTKRGIFSPPAPVRVDSKDVLLDPKTLDETALTEVKQHFERPPERQQ